MNLATWLFARERRAKSPVSFRVLRWLTVLLLLLFFGALELLLHALPFEVLRGWQFSVALFVSLAGALALFSKAVLDVAEAMQHRLMAQNQELAKMEAEARRQAAKLRGLHDAGLTLAADLSLDAVLQRVVELARDLVQARYGALGVFDEEGSIERFLTSGITVQQYALIGAPPQGRGLLGELKKVGHPLRVRDIASHPSSVGFPPGHPPMTSFLGVPISYKGRLLGNLYLTDKQDAPEFGEADSAIVVLFAAEAAVAIENARLHEQVQHLAIETERQRIAREMHDGLAQVLGYVNVKAGAARRLVSLGRMEQAAQELRQLEAAAQEVYVEVREAILGLRTITQGKQGLLAVLREYLERFSELSGIPVDLKVECDEAALALGPEAEVQLIRVIQEALSNVRKHAKAHRAVVRLGVEGEITVLTVEDDGRGFSTERSTLRGGPQFGLQTMRERVESLGGSFAIDTVLGRGTRIVVRVPRTDGMK